MCLARFGYAEKIYYITLVTNEQRQILEKTLPSLEKAELIELLLSRIERLDRLEDEVKGLQEKLDQALRASTRQAAPFSKGHTGGKSSGAESPKRGRPGRKPGHKGTCRRPSAEPEEGIEALSSASGSSPSIMLCEASR
jgi:hypothetical protein